MKYYAVCLKVITGLFKGPFKCYVAQYGVGGCQISLKKALRRYTVQVISVTRGLVGGC